jgi:hypothetical protein
VKKTGPRTFVGPPAVDEWDANPSPPDDLAPPEMTYEAANTTTEYWRAYVDFRESDRLHGRRPVANNEQLDTALIDLQFGDIVASDGIGKVKGSSSARTEFERRLRDAEGL